LSAFLVVELPTLPARAKFQRQERETLGMSGARFSCSERWKTRGGKEMKKGETFPLVNSSRS
jgi:hypothetical protein